MEMIPKKKPHPNSLANLEKGKFKKGNKLGGRPPGAVSFKTIIAEYLTDELELRDPLTQKRVRKELKKHLTARLIAKALSGDLNAMKEVIDRHDGKVTQNANINITTQEDALKELE
jgi:hypothetical protein